MPESARWLLANGKAEEAHAYIVKCAKMNNRYKSVADVTPKVIRSMTFDLFLLIINLP